MPMLSLNGISIPISQNDNAKRGIIQIGESVRAVDGTMRAHRRVLKRTWEFATPVQDPLTAWATRRLILGEGHYWSFDDSTKGFYSSKGLPYSAATGATLTAGSAYIGAGKLSLSATTGTITFTALPLLTSQPWTVIVARNVNAGGWNHYIKDSAGNVWTNGVLTGSTPWLTVTGSAGTVKIDADATFATTVDELVVLPYRIPADWASQIYTYANGGLQWAPLARLYADGDAFYQDSAAGALQVFGTTEDQEFISGRYDASWGFQPNLQKLSFKLEEV